MLSGTLLAGPENLVLNDPSLLFAVTYEKLSLRADSSREYGECTSFSDQDLQLRMHAGIAGKGNALCLAGNEYCIYNNYKNFDPKHGTVSFWISPKNWNGSSEYFQVFFQSVYDGANGGFKLIVEKFMANSLRFYIKIEQEEHFIETSMPDTEWKPGVWHKIDAIWDAEEMRFYLDGRLVQVSDIYSQFNPLKLNPVLSLPESSSHGFMALGDNRGYRFNSEEKTVYDNFRVYNRKLTDQEIQEEYCKYYPRQQNDRDHERNLICVPFQSGHKPNGNLSGDTWQGASQIPIRCPPGRATVFLDGDYVLLQHDGKFLYVGAKIMGANPKTSCLIRDDDLIWQKDDEFEIFLCHGMKYYQFIVNAAGTLWDSTGDANSGNPPAVKKWNTSGVFQVERHKEFWNVVAKIPLAEIGIVGGDQSLTANFGVKHVKDRGKSIEMMWAKTPMEFYDVKSFGKLVLSKDTSFARLVSIGEPENGRLEIVLQASVGAVGSASLVSLGNTLSSYSNLAETPWVAAPTAGIWDLAVASDVKGKPVLRYFDTFNVNSDIQADSFGFPSRGIIITDITLSGSAHKLGMRIFDGSLSCKVEFVDSRGKVYSSKTAKVREISFKTELPIPNTVPPGTYYIRTVVTGSNGVHLETSQEFKVPDMTPYRVRTGLDHHVPSPWTKLESTDRNSFRVLGREYFFEKSPFPVRITSGGKELLATAPDFKVKISGQSEDVNWKEFRQLNQTDDHADFEGQGSSASLSFKWQGTLWFDGLWHLELDVSPKNTVANISDFSLSWKMPSKYVRGILNPLFVPWNAEKGVALDYHSGLQDFLVWTVGIKEGIVWMPLTTANWVNRPGEKQITLLPSSENTVEETINFITVPANLTKTARYSMAFMATPGKVVDSKLRDYNFGHIWGYSHGETTKAGGHLNNADAFKLPYTMHPWAMLTPLKPREFRTYLDMLAEKGIRFSPYCQPAFTATIEDDYRYFFKETEQIPGIVAGGAVNYVGGGYYDSLATCPHTSSGDLHSWQLVQAINKYPDLYGFYYDLCQVTQCSNILHGHGGIDAFGKPYTSSTMLSLREFMIRIYKIIHANGMCLKIHAHNRFIPFVHHFADVWSPGEQYNFKIMKNPRYFFCEDISLPEYQCAYYPDIKGIRICMESQLEIEGWHYTNTPCDPIFIKDSAYTISYMTAALLHDMNVTPYYARPETVEKFWDIKANVHLADAEFHGYWFDDTVRSESPDVYVSWYSFAKPSPYSCVLFVGNIGRKEQRAALRINQGKLIQTEKKISIYDLWNGKPVANLNSLTIDGNSFLIIGVGREP